MFNEDEQGETNDTTNASDASAKKGPSPGGSLRGASVRHLRALGHHLAPVVQIGKEGVTEALILATKGALLRHELVKVKILREAPVDRHDAGNELAESTQAALVQVLGRTLLLYKRNPKKARIDLPKTRKQATALAKDGPKKKKKNRRRAKRTA